MLLLELMTRWNDHLPVLKLSESKYLADVKHLSTINDLIQKKGKEEGFTPEQISAFIDTFSTINPTKS
jgi:DNA-binding MltR family transcriptional regulator